MTRRKELGIKVYAEQRVQVSPTRFRIPDVTVVKTSQIQGEIFTSPPHLCIEILSKDDTMRLHAGKDRRLSGLRRSLRLDH